MRDGYRYLADYYDALMRDVDYDAWTDFYERCFRRYQEKMPKLLLDLGCGTGRMTVALARRGYEMIGLDLSTDMLSHAEQRADDAGQKILYLAQDMRGFDLYGTVDAVVCSLDCVNYLTKKEDVACCFDRVHTFLNPDGLFLFDVNTPYKFAHIFGQESYILEDEHVFLGWQNDYTESTGLCRFYLTFFCEKENGLWERLEEEQRERAYSDKTLSHLLAKSGFTVLDIVSDFAGTKAGNTDERHYFICKRNA